MSQHGSCFASATTNNGVSPKEVFYLTNVFYNEQKHEVLVEFSNSSSRRIVRERFYPFILISSSIERTKLESLLVSAGFRGFSIGQEGDLLCLRALSFSELNKISNSLAVFINKKPLVLSPQRAFLLRKGWSYFDSFEAVGESFYRISAGEIACINNSSSGGVLFFDLGFFLTKEISFSEALRLSEEDALFLVERAAWSNILSVPINEVPSDADARTELFLENIFFRHGELISFNHSDKLFSNNGFEPLGFSDSLSKVDFSLVWAELFSNNFFNIGPETRNCSCCRPVALESKNILPSSLIRIGFLEDNLFFESCSESFAQEFHSSYPYSDLRSSKKKEFFLNSFPVGPFFRGDVVQVPLLDAKRLISDGKAKLVLRQGIVLPSGGSGSGFSKECVSLGSAEVEAAPQIGQELHSLNWFCLNKESFFSKEVRNANALLFSLRKCLDFGASSLFSSNNFANLYFGALYRSLSFSLARIPVQLTSPNSKFFSTDLAKSIVSVQESTIAKFREFSERKGFRVLHANRQNAYVRGASSLALAKDFSRENCLPQPQIAGFSNKSAGGFA